MLPSLYWGRTYNGMPRALCILINHKTLVQVPGFRVIYILSPWVCWSSYHLLWLTCCSCWRIACFPTPNCPYTTLTCYRPVLLHSITFACHACRTLLKWGSFVHVASYILLYYLLCLLCVWFNIGSKKQTDHNVLEQRQSPSGIG